MNPNGANLPNALPDIEERSTPTGYFNLTRTASYSFIASLPLFIAYEALILWANAGNSVQVRISAEIWIKRMLAGFGIAGHIALGVLLLLIGFAILFSERKKQIPFHQRYFLIMIAESFFYAIVIGIIISRTVGMLFARIPAYPMISENGLFDLFTNISLSIGAGPYEELFFRVLLVGGLYLSIRLFIQNRARAYTVSAIIAALIFSGIHYIGIFGDPFIWSSFVFRFLFGLALNMIFLVRGFGVAAWTHAIYDILVVTEII
ncbi:MAG: hypothetical protein B6244_10015 [Candidatus Cloacimonetes bacterium 4572_55]|nr:MAG: hypothetical protein B6244_10015 [Candidatus Cloacimonetes bacterium 4572_55]